MTLEEYNKNNMLETECNTIDNSKYGATNTMAALGVIFSIAGIFFMVKYTNKKGFWWGLGFFIIGGALGSAFGRLIEPPKCNELTIRTDIPI